MEVICDINQLDTSYLNKPVVTLGTFDGVHLGHQSIIRKLVEKAKEKGEKSVLVTYQPHPQLVVDPKTAPFVLTTLEEKLYFLKRLGLDLTIVIKFNKEFSEMKAEDFVEKILIDKLNAGELVIGYDHAFGEKREGRLELLEKKAQEFGFDLEVISPVKNDDLPIKSTRIREAFKSKDFESGISMLGHGYPILGERVKGRGLGEKLGFPTINLKVSERKLIPQNGVFSAEVRIEKKLYGGMVYSGENPTFEEKHRSLEVNIFNYRQKEEKKKVFLFLFDWIRPDLKFSSLEELKKRLKKDEKEVKRALQQKNSKGGLFANRETKKTRAY